jgi:hypothetical protein
MKSNHLSAGMDVIVSTRRGEGFRQRWILLAIGLLAWCGSSARAENSCKNVWMNLSAPAYWSTEVPFADLLKSADTWRNTKLYAGAYNPHIPLDLDEHGWVKSLNNDPENGQQTASAYILSALVKSHLIDYHWQVHGQPPVIDITFDGKADLQIMGIQEAQIILNASGKVSVTLNNDSSDFVLVVRKIIPTANHPYPKNFRVVPAAWEAYATPGHPKYPFNPSFLDKLSPFKGVRFMNWQRINTELEYPVTGKQQAWKARWGDRARVDDAFWSSRKGVPIEICARLCNVLKIGMWINVPHTATLAGTKYKYPDGMADLLAAQLDPGIHVVVEHSNEIWNNATFLQYYDCSKAGYIQGLATPTPAPGTLWENLTYEQQWFSAMRYHSLRTQVIGGIFRNKLGVSRVTRVYGSALPAGKVWTDKLLTLDNTAANIDVVAVAPYIARHYTNTSCDCSPGDPKCQSPNSNWCQVIGSGACCASAEPCWPNATLFGCKVFKFDNIADLMDDIEADIPQLAKEVAEVRIAANNHGKAVWFYEFGQHLVTMPDQWDNQYVNGWVGTEPGLFNLAQVYHGEWGGPGMKQLYLSAIEQLSAAAINPAKPTEQPVLAHFVLASPQDKSGRWGALTHIFEDSWLYTAPKYEALVTGACAAPKGGIGE